MKGIKLKRLDYEKTIDIPRVELLKLYTENLY